jgi:hypothetical protein
MAKAKSARPRRSPLSAALALTPRQPVSSKAAISPSASHWKSSVGGQRGYADWTSADHRLRRLLAEFIGTAGLTFVPSGGAAVLVVYGGTPLQPWQTVFVLSLVSALWLVAAVYFLGDISAHFNPVTTLAFALRRDMGWPMAVAYWAVQFTAAIRARFLRAAYSANTQTSPRRCRTAGTTGRPLASRRSSLSDSS